MKIASRCERQAGEAGLRIVPGENMAFEFEGGRSIDLPDEVFGSMIRSETFMKAVAELTQFVVSADGSLTLAAEDLLALRDTPQREKILHELVGAVAPTRPMMMAWRGWLSGGVPPTEPEVLKKPGSARRAIKDYSERADKSRIALTKKADDARQRLASAQEALEKAEREVEFHDSAQRADMLWRISDHLAQIMAGTFAVGPAWTVLRALSGYISDEELKFAAAFSSDEAERIEAQREAMQTKKDETQTMMLVLDQHCGDPEFEAEIRKAILGVVMKFKDREPDQTGPIYRRRGKETIRKSVQPEGHKNAEEILDGLHSNVG